MIGLDEALAIVAGEARPLGTETVKLSEAAGRFLAAPVIAGVGSPPADVSAMDGYAVREEDLPRLKRVGVSYPGAPFEGCLGRGECIRIFTGAAVPEDADRVIVQEIVQAEGDQVLVVGEWGTGRHIRRRGSDFEAGETLLVPGTRLTPRSLVAAAGADAGALELWRRPRVVVLGTGDELVEPGQAGLSAGSIPESVSLGVAAMVELYGGTCIARRRVRDDPDEFRRAAAEALDEADLVVVTGGASVGEKDYSKQVFASLGTELAFSKVAIKPGKPVWFGRCGAKLVMGLPGNPTSALVTARLLLAPLVRGLAGGAAMEAVTWRQAWLAEPMPPCGDRETFVRGRWQGDRVAALSNQDSGAQRTLAEAELLIRRQAGAPAAAAGERAEIMDF